MQQQQQQQLPIIPIQPVRNGHGIPQSPTRMSIASYKETGNSVDSWIDDLDENYVEDPTAMLAMGINPQMMMSWLIQQYLPKMKLPYFDGAPLDWVTFIVKFRDIVHKQEYLHNTQRSHLLLQQLKGEAERSVRVFANDPKGYVRSLKKLKQLFGQRSLVARAVLDRVTKGKIVQNEDLRGLMELSYSINDCMTTLKQLDYESDLNSSDTLRQVVHRLPKYLQWKWGEHSMYVKRTHEPSLIDLEEWLNLRVMARRETNPIEIKMRDEKKKFNGAVKNDPVEELAEDNSFNGAVTDDVKCVMCKEGHNLWKCKEYLDLDPKAKYDLVRKLQLCFNCLSAEHKIYQCTSKRTCFTKGCKKKHHTSLHDHFAEKGETNNSEKDGQNVANDSQEKDDEKQEKKKKKKKKGKDAFSGHASASQDRTTTDDEDASSDDGEEEVILQIVPIRLYGRRKKYVDTYGLLDIGSQVTLIREDIASKLKLKGRERRASN